MRPDISGGKNTFMQLIVHELKSMETTIESVSR